MPLPWPIYWTIQGLLSLASLVVLCLMARCIRKLRSLELEITKNALNNRNDADKDRQVEDLASPCEHRSLNGEIILADFFRPVCLIGRLTGQHSQQGAEAGKRPSDRIAFRVSDFCALLREDR
jgi:hypothetical protein